MNSQISPRNASPELLKVASSRTNQILFFTLIVATFGVIVLTGLSYWFLLFFGSTIYQGLRTYMFVALFTRTHVEYRSTFGVWHTAEYSKLLVLPGLANSISLVGEDTQEKSIKLVIMKTDGDLAAIAAYVKGTQSVPAARHS